MNDCPHPELMELNIIPLHLYRFSYLLTRDFKPSVSEELKLNKTLGKTLMILYRRGSQTMTELVQNMNIEKGSMTSVIDSLIEKNLAVRERDSSDRRRVIINLTEKGAALSEIIGIEMNNHIRSQLEKLGDENKNDIGNFMKNIKKYIDILENQIET